MSFLINPYSFGTQLSQKGSFLFDAGTDYFVSSAASLLNDEIKGSSQKFSISIWLKRNTSVTDGTTISGFQTVFSRDNNSGGRQFALEFRGTTAIGNTTGGFWSFYIFTDASNYSFWETTFPLYSTNNWYNLIVTFDNTQSLANKCKIYVNGVDEVLSRNDTGAGVSTVSDSPSEPIYISVTNFGGLVNPFKGYVGRICFWTDIISQSDATAIWNNGVNVNERSISLSKSIFMQFDPAQSSYSSGWTMGDTIGTSYGVSKNFVSSGLVQADFDATKYPSINLNTNTNTLLAQMSTSPSLRDQYLIDSFIQNTIDDGNWTELDEIWFFAAHAQQAGRLRWKNPTGSELTEVSSIAWTSNVGYTGDGVADYLDMNFNLATNGVKFTLNSASIGAYLLDNKNEASAAFGIVNGAGTILVPRNGGVQAARTNTTGTNIGGSISDSRGLRSIGRTASNSQFTKVNGTGGSTNTTASTAIPSGNLYALAYNNAGAAALFSTNRMSCLYIGSSALDHVKLYNRIREFLYGKGL